MGILSGVNFLLVLCLIHRTYAQQTVAYRTTYVSAQNCLGGEIYLGDTGTINAPDSVSGTVKVNSDAFTTDCEFTVKVRRSVTDRVALYMNVRELDLTGSDSIDVYDYTLAGSSGPQIKRMGRWQPFSGPRSFDQLRSSFGSSPSLKFNIRVRSSPSYKMTRLQLDWTLVSKYSPGLEWSTCAALNGYVHDRLRCEYLDADRVNCPYDYIGRTNQERVTSKNHLSRYNYPCTKYFPQYTYGGLNTGEIAGIVFSVIFVFAVIGGFVGMARRRTRIVQRTAVRAQATFGAGAAVTVTQALPTGHAANTVVGGGRPYPAYPTTNPAAYQVAYPTNQAAYPGMQQQSQMQPYPAGPPPMYDTVTGQTQNKM